jgi:hypothetical protein
MRKWLAIAVLAVVAVWCHPAAAQKKKAKKAQPAADKSLVSGPNVEKKVALLTREVNWLSSLEEAKEQGREQQKAIFWLHALGDLEGVT